MAEDFAEKLNAVLSNPDAMGQIMSIAQALSGGGQQDKSGQEAPSAPPEQDYSPVEPEAEGGYSNAPATISSQPSQQQNQGQSPPIDIGAILNMVSSFTGGGGQGSGSNPLSALSDLDPRIIQMGIRLLGEFNHTDDRRIALLAALKPFVKEERFEKVDKAIQIARIARVVRAAIQAFREGGESGDV